MVGIDKRGKAAIPPQAALSPYVNIRRVFVGSSACTGARGSLSTVRYADTVINQLLPLVREEVGSSSRCRVIAQTKPHTSINLYSMLLVNIQIA
ncbi:hypothetical protein BAUCODRAFT_39855 [Baudoinia panamericana UAMH 10762]|uniref:Uncharacterized protein n=1 Tax=Baudoinia panamericana (strain UAMH 10762) TaxID=717646 RepID=M2LAK3_BAUPA|nr:uncharacterized protein BAUCODRAFT_39855 [Baudoinia panamericana UAMH 10762]EMC90842.1 hypothetical protein BAUCODRAFT_39855 [Baudoinia panamericana UAMH 10762]